jgi:hypothetical protein
MKKKNMGYAKWHTSNTVRPQSTLLIGPEDFHYVENHLSPKIKK